MYHKTSQHRVSPVKLPLSFCQTFPIETRTIVHIPHVWMDLPMLFSLTDACTKACRLTDLKYWQYESNISTYGWTDLNWTSKDKTELSNQCFGELESVFLTYWFYFQSYQTKLKHLHFVRWKTISLDDKITDKTGVCRLSLHKESKTKLDRNQSKDDVNTGSCRRVRIQRLLRVSKPLNTSEVW